MAKAKPESAHRTVPDRLRVNDLCAIRISGHYGVEKRTPGKAEAFEDKGVEDAAKRLLIDHRRKEWEANYLKILQQRIADERSGNSKAAAEKEKP